MNEREKWSEWQSADEMGKLWSYKHVYLHMVVNVTEKGVIVLAILSFGKTTSRTIPMASTLCMVLQVCKSATLQHPLSYRIVQIFCKALDKGDHLVVICCIHRPGLVEYDKYIQYLCRVAQPTGIDLKWGT